MSIQWPLAKDTLGSYIHIGDTVSKEQYFCPECSGRFIARMGTKVKHHFAHYRGIVCTGEGSRHSIAKHYIAILLGNPVTLPLMCQSNRLPTKAYRLQVWNVEIEYAVGEYIVDVACERNGKPIYVEVIDTHPTDLEKSRTLKDALVEVKIKDLSDQEVFFGEKVRERLLGELAFFLPTMPEGPYDFIHTWTTRCWKCKKEVPVALRCEPGDESKGEYPGAELWPQNFPKDLLTEMQKYAKLEWRTTSIMKEGYIANICPSCNTVQGDFYLQDELLDLSYTPEKVMTVFWTRV